MEERELGRQSRESHRLTRQQDGEAEGGEGKKEDGGQEKKSRKRQELGVLDLSLVKTDPNKLYPLIYFALKVGCESSIDYSVVDER